MVCSETRVAEVGEIKEGGVGTSWVQYMSSCADAKVKEGVNQFTLPLKQNLLVSFQGCLKAPLTA